MNTFGLNNAFAGTSQIAMGRIGSELKGSGAALSTGTKKLGAVDIYMAGSLDKKAQGYVTSMKNLSYAKAQLESIKLGLEQLGKTVQGILNTIDVARGKGAEHKANLKSEILLKLDLMKSQFDAIKFDDSELISANKDFKTKINIIEGEFDIHVDHLNALKRLKDTDVKFGTEVEVDATYNLFELTGPVEVKKRMIAVSSYLEAIDSLQTTMQAKMTSLTETSKGITEVNPVETAQQHQTDMQKAQSTISVLMGGNGMVKMTVEYLKSAVGSPAQAA